MPGSASAAQRAGVDEVAAIAQLADQLDCRNIAVGDEFKTREPVERLHHPGCSEGDDDGWNRVVGDPVEEVDKPLASGAPKRAHVVGKHRKGDCNERDTDRGSEVGKTTEMAGDQGAKEHRRPGEKAGH